MRLYHGLLIVFYIILLDFFRPANYMNSIINKRSKTTPENVPQKYLHASYDIP